MAFSNGQSLDEIGKACELEKRLYQKALMVAGAGEPVVIVALLMDILF